MAAPLLPAGAPGRPDRGGALVRVALQLGSTSVAHVDVAAMLSGVCVALPPAAGARGAVLLLDDPADPGDPDGRRLFTSDTAADRMGLVQDRTGNGPLPAAVRGDRTLVTPDLRRDGPPELAAAAAGCGLVRSIVVPVPVAGHTAGGLQLLGGADAVLDEYLAALLRPVVTMLGARLADVRELARLSAVVGSRADQPPCATSPVPRVPAPRAEVTVPGASPERRSPAPRARHRLREEG